MSEWVDLQLSHQLAPVEAPAELWQRLEPCRVRRRRAVPRLALATAAAVLVVIAVAYSSIRSHEIPRASTFSAGSCNLCHTM